MSVPLNITIVPFVTVYNIELKVRIPLFCMKIKFEFLLNRRWPVAHHETFHKVQYCYIAKELLKNLTVKLAKTKYTDWHICTTITEAKQFLSNFHFEYCACFRFAVHVIYIRMHFIAELIITKIYSTSKCNTVALSHCHRLCVLYVSVLATLNSICCCYTNRFERRRKNITCQVF